jgi:hypothetical protein
MKRSMVTVAVVAAGIALYFIFTQPAPIPFDQAVWISSKNCKPIAEASKRYLMVEDLKTKLSGKSKSDLKEILGEGLPGINGENQLRYCLGKGRFTVGMDFKWLHLNFDENNTYRSSSIETAD